MPSAADTFAALKHKRTGNKALDHAASLLLKRPETLTECEGRALMRNAYVVGSNLAPDSNAAGDDDVCNMVLAALQAHSAFDQQAVVMPMLYLFAAAFAVPNSPLIEISCFGRRSYGLDLPTSDIDGLLIRKPECTRKHIFEITQHAAHSFKSLFTQVSTPRGNDTWQFKYRGYWVDQRDP